MCAQISTRSVIYTNYVVRGTDYGHLAYSPSNIKLCLCSQLETLHIKYKRFTPTAFLIMLN